MIPRSRLVEELRGRGYTFKAETRACLVYKQRGGTNRIMVPRTKTVTETYVKSAFAQAGASPEETAAFIASCRQETP